MGSSSPAVKMTTKGITSLLVLSLSGAFGQLAKNDTRNGRVFSLFSIVQFPNLRCTSSTSSTTYGTCLTSSECTTNGGSSDGNCAAGFGVCCIIYTSTCSATVSTNTSYIRNPGYPSTYTPSSTGTCVFTISKVSSEVCQLRLDFETMSGYVTTTAGACTDSFTALGQTGKTVPSICGTNTGYHMYVEFGALGTDTISLTHTLGATTSTLKWNILAQQIPCTATYRAPTDCLQWFTGSTGTVYSYNHQGGQLANGMDYTNCIRTEDGFCGIEWKEKSDTTVDAYHVFASASTAVLVACPTMNTYIPNLSYDGIKTLAASGPTAATGATYNYQSIMCGGVFGVLGPAVSIGPMALISRAQPFILGVHTTASPSTNAATNTGFALDYSQVGCL